MPDTSEELTGSELSNTAVVVAPASSKYLAERQAVESLIGTEAWQKVSWMESVMEAHPDSFRELPLKHVFTPGLYCRTIYMPQGALLTSRVHLTQHPFFVLSGVVSVWDDASGWVTLAEHDSGITNPGTRRILFIHEDCAWMTIHPNPENETDPEKIVESVTYDHRKLRELEGVLN
jgi:hypothetical protein